MTAELHVLEHLTDEDLRFLVDATGIGGRDPERIVDLLREEPKAIEPLLRRPELFQRIFQEDREEVQIRLSPFFLFAVLVHRVHEELKNARYVLEWAGPRRRLPVFEVKGMRRFLDSAPRRYYLADVLASFTRVVSGTYWIQTKNGPRRQRFHTLDPIQLAAYVEVAEGTERLMGYRRLGDLAMFLAGIFPDHFGRNMLRNLDLTRLAKVAGMRSQDMMALQKAGHAGDPNGAITIWEELGRRWYRLASQAPARVMRTGAPPFGLEDIDDPFPDGRRVLNYLSDRFIRDQRNRWFPDPAA